MKNTPNMTFNRFLCCVFLLLNFSSAGLVGTAYAQNIEQVTEAAAATDLPTGDAQSNEQSNAEESQEDGENADSADADSGSDNDAKKGEEDFSLGLNIAETLNVEDAVHSWEEQLNQTLEKFGINETWFGKLIGTLAILLITFICWMIVNHGIKFFKKKSSSLAQKYHVTHRHLEFNFRLVRIFLKILLSVIAFASVSSIWQLPIFDLFSEENVYWLLQSAVSVFAILFLASLLLALSGNLVEKAFDKFGETNNARVQTLIPITKNLIFAVIFVLFGLTLLSELGINVMPLLAGAGVVGFAIGFGAQTFFKDLITGFIIVIEDLVQVGDVVAVGGRTGVVERITIRKMQLRNLEGIVSTVPFSEIGIVDNYTKLFSYYLMNVGVAYRENTDEVIKLLRQVDEEMREDDNYKDNILEPIEILGVDAFADSAVVIKARIKTRPIKQWEIGREFNRRMKFLFDEKGIEIPFPHQTIYFGEDKDGTAPPMNLKMAESVEVIEKRREQLKEDSDSESDKAQLEHKQDEKPEREVNPDKQESTGYDKKSKIQKEKQAEEQREKREEKEKKQAKIQEHDKDLDEEDD